jgi:hypothetical protein
MKTLRSHRAGHHGWMFDGRRVSSPGARYIDDINAAKETQYGKFVDHVLRWFRNANKNAAIKRGRSNLIRNQRAIFYELIHGRGVQRYCRWLGTE